MILRRSLFQAIPGGLLAASCIGRESTAGRRRPRSGDRLRLTGTLVSRDDRTPLAGYSIHVYQTDADGYYSRPDNDARNAELRASLVTDDRGRYAYDTIVPGHYPGREMPRHIHVHLAGPDVPEHWIDDFWFAGDPYLDAAQEEKAVVLRRARGGGWRGRRDLVLDPELAIANRLVDETYRQGG
jgi:protocatechuate 3,4-dioxygenase beta subunit